MTFATERWVSAYFTAIRCRFNYEAIVRIRDSICVASCLVSYNQTVCFAVFTVCFAVRNAGAIVFSVSRNDDARYWRVGKHASHTQFFNVT